MPRSIAMEILSGILASHGPRVPRGGPVGDREFETGNFDRLEISGPVDVEVETGAPPRVRATGPEWALDNLSIENDGDRLLMLQ